MSTRSRLAFLKTETGAGLLLGLVALLALVWANSPWAGGYARLIGRDIVVQFGPFSETMTFAGWVKTALMPVFFFVAGLQIKEEMVRGELANPRRLALPLMAAAGGILVPALIYLAVNIGEGGVAQGWPATAPTDIAVALAVLTVAGPRLPSSLRVLLLTVTLVHLLAAIALGAVLFTGDLRPGMLAGAVATLALLVGMSRWRTCPYVFWTLGFILLWGFTLKAGIDTAAAGLAAALCVPLRAKRPGGPGVLDELIEALHPYVAFFVLPLFVLTAAGVTLADLRAEVATAPVALGIALALVLGKQIGVFGALALAIGLKLDRRPTGAHWLELYGVAVLCGIGFTMSLYLGERAFPATDDLAQAKVRVGVLAGSVASALLGWAVLAWSNARRSADPRA
ncbi:Na+/H+ antiporter NhaA [Phenylobacterium sp. J367]|uniref:Na+/H+ antiporter NhaA n=1 Tax=Phenylobacterium sp. J367 TaxID=2898435 RepID=UPI002150A101|nr:Na+/H+ antiporter NhaA [Phenylobacterium sp. J367]MCR5877342.1 Na+/H+ antiporter NhaA [Phenylobacterium sp. J367]